eukprot:2199881-Pyramimonas_sp.AAC.1
MGPGETPRGRAGSEGERGTPRRARARRRGAPVAKISRSPGWTGLAAARPTFLWRRAMVGKCEGEGLLRWRRDCSKALAPSEKSSASSRK